MISLGEARHLLFQCILRPADEEVGIEDALGRVASRDIRAPHNLPREVRSRLDGFAVRCRDAAEASTIHPISLRLRSGFLAAGHESNCELAEGDCLRVMTGAAVPPGADAVLAQEHAIIEKGCLILNSPIRSGTGLIREGSDAVQGELLVAGGEVLTPSRLGLAASFGFHRVFVAPQPRVALLSTGDEICELGGRRHGPVSYSNTRHLLAWLVRLQGGVPIHLGISRDDPDEIIERLGRVGADLFITTGGTGQGEKDFISQVWERIGAAVLFRGVNVLPGRGTAVGVRQGVIYLALPGNPWAARVVFEELIKPVIWAFQNARCRWPVTVRALLKSGVDNGDGVCRAVSGVLDLTRWPASFEPAAKPRGSVTAEVRNRFGYMILESHMLEVSAGSGVDIRLFDLPLLAVATLGRSEGQAGDPSPDSLSALC